MVEGQAPGDWIVAIFVHHALSCNTPPPHTLYSVSQQHASVHMQLSPTSSRHRHTPQCYYISLRGFTDARIQRRKKFVLETSERITGLNGVTRCRNCWQMLLLHRPIRCQWTQPCSPAHQACLVCDSIEHPRDSRGDCFLFLVSREKTNTTSSALHSALNSLLSLKCSLAPTFVLRLCSVAFNVACRPTSCDHGL